MTVAELIEYLRTQPQDIHVVYKLCSEQCLLNAYDINIKDLCEARPDGWVQNERPDKPTRPYLVFPGN